MKKTFAIIGCGFLGNVVADAYKNDLLEGYELTGALSRTADNAKKLIEGTNARLCGDIKEIIALKPDYIIETASVAKLKEFATEALLAGISVVPLSIGAFADKAFYDEAVAAAIKGNAKIHIPAGAVGGFDVLQTIALMAEAKGLDIKAGISTRKGPKSLQNTLLFDESLLDEGCEKEVFSGTAAEAIALLPTKVNVAVASSLATTGPDKATARITSVEGMTGDDHRIVAECEGLRADVDIYSATSEIAGWSIVALLRNLASPVVFY